ncbi:MAG: lysylphosphatidylglycerol synthase transmembrane domain-containing protein [Anaerolineales bacterium]
MNTSPAKKPITLTKVISFCVGLVVLYLLLSQINFRDLSRLLFTIKPFHLLLGGFIYLCKASVRSYRITRLNKSSRLSQLKMLRLSLASSLASQILPFKLGEFSYVYLLNREDKASVTQGLSSLVILRVFDILAVAILFLGISLWEGLPDDLSNYYVPVLIFMAAVALAFGVWMLASRLKGFALGQVQGWKIFSMPIAQKALRGIESLVDSLKQYRAVEYPLFILLAVVEWTINYATFHVIMLGMGFTPTIFATVVAVSFSILASVLPINSLGNFGTQEAGWTSGLLLMGFSKTDAIASGFATHLITLGYMILFGGIAWISYWLTSASTVDQGAGQT